MARHPSHPGVAGLRARPKPERSWFDSRGWDEHPAVPGTARHPGAVGLRARLKPERSWFDPRGWHVQVGSKSWRCSGLLLRLHVGSIPTRPTRGRRTCLRAPTSIQPPVSSETTKQVKCCGDTPVRHTGVVGFNSHHLLDPTGLLAPPRGHSPRGPHPRATRFARRSHGLLAPILCLPSSAGSSGRMVRGRSPVRFRREALANASLAQQEVATAS